MTHNHRNPESIPESKHHQCATFRTILLAKVHTAAMKYNSLKVLR